MDPDPSTSGRGRARDGGARRPRVAFSAALVVVLVGGSQTLGFVRDAVNAWAFGASGDYDAFLVAQGLMNVVLGLIGSAMAKATVPTVSRAVRQDRSRSGLHSAQVGLTLAICVLVLGSTAMWWFAPSVVAVLGPGFDGPTARTAVELTRIMLVASVFIAGTNILAAAAEAHHKFFAAGVQGVPFNAVMIAAAVAFGGVFGVRAIAVGFVVGSVLRFLIQIPPVRRLGMSLRPSFDLRDGGFQEMLRFVPLLLVGSAVTNVNTLVDRAVGTLVGPGTISALSYGYRLVRLPHALLVMSLVTALYPSLGAISGRAERPEMRRLVHRGIGVLSVLLAPIVACLIVAGRFVVIVVFGRGDFGPSAVSATTTAVTFFAVGLFALGIRTTLTRAAYALGDARAPVACAFVGVAVNVAGDLLLGLRFGVVGIAASTSISLFVTAGLLAVSLQRRHDVVHPRTLLPAVGVPVAAAAVAAGAGLGALVGTRTALGVGDSASTSTAVLLVAVTAVPLFLVYAALLRLAHRDELAETVGLARDAAARMRLRLRRRG